MPMVSAKDLLSAFRSYANLLDALGHRPKPRKVAECLCNGSGKPDKIEKILLQGRRGKSRSAVVDEAVVERLRGVTGALMGEIRGPLAELEGNGSPGPATPDALAELIRGLEQRQRETIADTVARGSQKDLLAQRYVSVVEFQRMLREFAGGQTIARGRLIQCIKEEFRKRGIHMSADAIEERLRPNSSVRTMPYCIKEIFEELGEECLTGLIPLEELVGDEDPDLWLERVRATLLFRSHSSMHRAVAKATGLKYDSVHKALSGRRKAKRIQKQIKTCLDQWLEAAQKGEDIPVEGLYRGVPVERLCALLRVLDKTFRSREHLYRVVAESTGINNGSIRRYFQENGQLRHAPLEVYRTARQLAEGANGRWGCGSYLRDDGVKEAADRIAASANEALKRWRKERDCESEFEFKHLRRTLIATLKKGRADLATAV